MLKRIFAGAAAGAVLCGSMTGCSVVSKLLEGNTADTYTDYVKAVLDCTYLDKVDRYMELVDTTEEEAHGVYEDEVEYVTELICHNMAVESDYLSEETHDGYEALAKDIMAKAKYEVADAVKSGDTYHITVTCEPMDFWDITADAVEEYYQSGFGDRYEAAVEEEEIAELEEEYGQEVLHILSGYTGQIGYKDAVPLIVEIEEDSSGNYGISDKNWMDIDDLVFDMSANT